MFKKAIVTIVSLAIIAGSSLVTYADSQVSQMIVAEQKASVAASASSQDTSTAKITKDEAKEAAVKAIKEHFGYRLDEKRFETRAELRQDYERPDNYIWDISYQLNSNEKSEYYSVTIDGNTGMLLGFNKQEYNYRQEQNPIAKITKEQAKKSAEAFIKKFLGDKANQLKYIDDSKLMGYSYGYIPTEYSFRYIRIVNGIEFDRNYITVGVNGVDSKVTSMSFRWNDDKDFPKIDAVIGKDKAFELFKSEIEMEPAYVPYRKGNFDEAPTSIKLAYAPDFTKGYMIDAVDGKLIDWNGKPAEALKTKDLTEEQRKEFLQKAKPIEAASKEISEDRAAEVMKQCLKKLYGEDYELEYVGYSDKGSYWEAAGKKIWRGQFYKKGELPGYGMGNRGNIIIDALTEGVISIYKYDEPMLEENFTAKITWDEAYLKAIDLLAENFPDKIKEIKTEQVYSDSIEYFNGKRIVGRNMYFSFPRVVNGIDAASSNISIRIDAKTGTVNEIRCIWIDGLEYPAIQGSISKEQAKGIYLESNNAELVYTIITKDEGTDKVKTEIKAIYQMRPDEKVLNPLAGASYIEAFSGKFLNYNGEAIQDKKDAFLEKIKGHWAEDKLSILHSSSIIDEASFELDKEITRLDAIKMLVLAKGFYTYSTEAMEELKFSNVKKDDENYKYLQMAVRYGIIENKVGEFDGNGKITRAQMAELLVNLTAYSKIAAKGELFAMPFKDCKNIKAEKVGYIAVAKGLGICGGNNGKFRPNDNTTMGEFALSLYNSLQYIRN